MAVNLLKWLEMSKIDLDEASYHELDKMIEIYKKIIISDTVDDRSRQCTQSYFVSKMRRFSWMKVVRCNLAPNIRTSSHIFQSRILRVLVTLQSAIKKKKKEQIKLISENIYHGARIRS